VGPGRRRGRRHRGIKNSGTTYNYEQIELLEPDLATAAAKAK